VPVILLGDQNAACAQSRAFFCQVPGHPCLTLVTAAAACDALDQLIAPGRSPARLLEQR
jgi:hypothetical protein